MPKAQGFLWFDGKSLGERQDGKQCRIVYCKEVLYSEEVLFMKERVPYKSCVCVGGKMGSPTINDFCMIKEGQSLFSFGTVNS